MYEYTKCSLRTNSVDWLAVTVHEREMRVARAAECACVRPRECVLAVLRGKRWKLNEGKERTHV